MQLKRRWEKVNKKRENREELRKNSLTVPMSKQEKKDVADAASRMGVSMSTFARLVLKDFMKKGELN